MNIQERQEWQQRLIAEREDLYGRLTKLIIFVEGPMKVLPESNQLLLVAQQIEMSELLAVLDMRLHTIEPPYVSSNKAPAVDPILQGIYLQAAKYKLQLELSKLSQVFVPEGVDGKLIAAEIDAMQALLNVYTFRIAAEHFVVAEPLRTWVDPLLQEREDLMNTISRYKEQNEFLPEVEASLLRSQMVAMEAHLAAIDERLQHAGINLAAITNTRMDGF